jgi:hypothetical protein
MLSILLLVVLLVLFGSLLGLSGWIIQMQREQKRLRQALQRYNSLASQEATEAELNSKILIKQRELQELTQHQEQLRIQYDQSISQAQLDVRLDADIQQKQRMLSELARSEAHLSAEIRRLQQKLGQLNEEDDLQALGFYKPKYGFILSELYKQQFDVVVAQRKLMVKRGNAVICHKEWTVGEDAKKGKKMIADYLKILLVTFDSTCDTAISSAKSNNIERLEKTIRNAFERLNRWSKTLECEITEEYLRLRLRELDIKYEMEAKIQEEKERDKLLREQMVKERKEREAIEKARREEEEAALRELEQQQEIERIRREIEDSVGQQREQLEQQMKELEELRAKAKADKEDAISRARKLKSGYIYVISSLGSFEPGIYRICMTQSADPDKYVKDMNPVVPFPFNIYFKVFSEDASNTLYRLHQRFEERRVNKRNMRREFFRVSLDEINQAIDQIARETPFLKNIQRFDIIPLSEEYRWSRSSEQTNSQTPNSSYREDETA